MLAAQVLIDGPSELVFDYAIPEGLAIEPGHRVRVPLRNRPASGTVLRVHEPEGLAFDLRPLESLIDPAPLVTSGLLKLAEWMSGYYGTPLEHIMRSLLPEAVRQENHSEKTIKQAIASPDIAPETLTALAKRAKRQHAILSLLQVTGSVGLPVSQLGDGAAGPVKALAEKGLLTLKDIAVQRDPDGDETFLPDPAKTLNPEQAKALEEIRNQLDNPDGRQPILLYGITGSGKTEVYLQATQAVIEEGKTVIVLLPEISLTPQTVQRFKSRFSDNPELVAVLHSTLTQGERFDEWHRIRKGQARVVIGARSAIFAPLPDLGLILVDEEHETTYKQENPPKYHGRDLAVVRAHIEGATIVLGSATPSVESYHNAVTPSKNANTQKLKNQKTTPSPLGEVAVQQQTKYQLVPLTQRADGQSLPLVRIIDMRNEPKKGGLPILSQRLRHAIEQKLAAKDLSLIHI